MVLKPCLCGASSFAPRPLQNGDNNNPFSDRGHDKFDALLDAIEAEKRRIYTQIGSHEISYLCFDCSSANLYKPIVVRTRGQRQRRKSVEEISGKIITPHPEASSNGIGKPKNEMSNQKIEQKKSYLWDLLSILIFILFFLAFFGRSFAVCCTLIGWYLFPIIKGENENPRVKGMKKIDKVYTRMYSDRQIFHQQKLDRRKSL